MMTLKTYVRTPHVATDRSWADDDSTYFELPHEVTQEIASLTSEFSRDPGRAVAVLELLARSPRPMSRIRLGEELGIPAAALGRTITLLDEHGFVTWTRRFGVGLGVRFINHGERLAGHFERTFSHIVSPHLEMLVRDHGGTAFVGMRAGGSIMFPIATGRDATALLSAEPNCIRVAEHATTHRWTHTEINHSVPIQGIWSVACGEGFATLAARVTLAHSSACIGLRVPNPTSAAYEAAGHALVASAIQLTSSLRRQFPQ